MLAKIQGLINGNKLVGLCIVGIFLLFLLASRNENSLTPDSLTYINAATLFSLEKNLGNGFLSWPPLYPLLLSPYRYFNIDIYPFATCLNKVLFFLTVISLWMIARKTISSTSVLCFFLTATMLSGPFSLIFGFTWSETLYIPLCVLTTHFWTSFLSEKNRVLNFSVSCLLLSLSMLTRHVGVALFVTMIGTLLFSNNFNFREKIRFSLWLIASTFPYLLWLLRTWLISGYLTGPRPPSHHGNFLFNLDAFGNVVGHWIIPHIYFQSLGLLVVSILCVFLAGFVFLNKIYANRSGMPEEISLYKLQLIIFLIVYTGVHSYIIIASATRFNIDTPNDRYLAPVYWSTFLLIFMSFEFAWKVFNYKQKYRCKRMIEYFGVFCFLIWLSAPNVINDLIF